MEQVSRRNLFQGELEAGNITAHELQQLDAEQSRQTPLHFEGLKQGQLCAAQHLEGRALVNAGAGTGKTKTLVARYLELLLNEQSPAKVGEVLAITYTNAGADEMQARARESLRELGQFQLARQMGQSWISTIHGFCGRVLRRYALEAEIDPSLRVADELESRALRLEALDLMFERMILNSEKSGAKAKDLRLEDSHLENYYRIREVYSDASFREYVVKVYDALCRYGCDPAVRPELWHQDWSMALEIDEGTCSEASANISQMFLGFVHVFACIYDELRAARGVLDFNESLMRMHKLLKDERILAQLQKQFKYVMVDEAQDTNSLQMSIIETIAQNNLYQVGDVKQSIYRFQGAEPSLLYRFEEDVQAQGGSIYEIDINFRSQAGILSFSNALFDNEELLGRRAKPLTAHKQEYDDTRVEECVQLLHLDARNEKGKFDKAAALQAEAVWIANRFEEMKELRDSWSDFSVLVQYRSHASVLLEEFRRRGIPVLLKKGASLFDNPMVKEARLFLEVLAKPRDPEIFLKLLLGGLGRVSDQGIYELSCLRKEAALDYLWDAALLELERAQQQASCLSQQSDKEALQGLVQSIQSARDLVGTRSLSEIVSRAFSERELDLYYLIQNESAQSELTQGESGNPTKQTSPKTAAVQGGISLVGRQTYGGFQQFLRLADSWQASGRDPLLFAEDLRRQEDMGLFVEEESVSSPDEECVVINSIHGSKGLEYPVVALPLAGALRLKDDREIFMLHQVDSDKLILARKNPTSAEKYATPRYEELFAVHHEQSKLEAMRLLYVACTRAENQLLISYGEGGGDSLNDGMNRGMKAAQAQMQTLQQKELISLSKMDDFEVQQLLTEARVAEADQHSCTISETAHVDTGSHIRPEGPPRTTELSSALPIVINQVSASDIHAFYQCPRKFYLYRTLRLGELLDRDPKIATNKGSLIHLLLEWGSSKQASTLFARNRVSEEQAQEMLAVVDAFQSTRFFREIQKNSTRLIKEQSFSVQLSEHGQTPRYLKGFIDLMAWQNDGSLLIIDYKTGASEKTHGDYRAQADCYALAGLCRGIQEVKVLMVRPEVRDSLGEPEVFAFDYASDTRETLRTNLLATIEAMENAETAGLDGVDRIECAAHCSMYGALCEGAPAD